MPDLADGETAEMKGSGAKPYQLKNVGGVYSCTCPAWRNQSLPINLRTCKHIRKYRGDAAEEARLQSPVPLKPAKPEGSSEIEELPLLQGHPWDEEQDVTGWWMSEKLDGVRAYWNGKQFLSRYNNIFHAPEWFLAGLPTHPLDGELWIARKEFDRVSGLARQQGQSDEWKQVKYLIFDAPEAGGPFEDRVKFLHTNFPNWKLPYATLVEHVVCEGNDQLFAELERITDLGGEGVMLRKPGSHYEKTRSSTLLKVKKFLDTEATVIGYEAGKGRHKGRVGALRARIGDGEEFRVGTGLSDKERDNPPAVGSIITVKYLEMTKANKVPRHPVYMGLRTDGARPSVPVVRKQETPPTAPPKPEKPAVIAGKSDPVPIPVPATVATPAPASPSPSVPERNTTMAATAKRYFECTEEGASKFWEVWTEGNTVTTNWGKIGTTGQTKPKEFADEAKAKKEYDKLVAEKTGKGYNEKKRPA